MASELFKSGQPGTDCQANCHLSAPTELRQFPTCPDRQTGCLQLWTGGPHGARHWVIRACETQKSHLAAQAQASFSPTYSVAQKENTGEDTKTATEEP